MHSDLIQTNFGSDFNKGRELFFFQSSNKGVYNNVLYNVSDYRLTASYSIFVGKDSPPIQIGFIFDVSVYDPIVTTPTPNFTDIYIRSFGQH